VARISRVLRQGVVPEQPEAVVKVKALNQTRMFILWMFVVPETVTRRCEHAFGIWATRVRLRRFASDVEIGVNTRKRFAVLRPRQEDYQCSP